MLVKTKKKESLIETNVCDYAKQIGLMVLKMNSTNYAGLPDRMFLHKGKCMFIEFKTPGVKPSHLQEITIMKLKSTGFKVHVVDNVEEGKLLVAEFFCE